MWSPLITPGAFGQCCRRHCRRHHHRRGERHAPNSIRRRQPPAPASAPPLLAIVAPHCASNSAATTQIAMCGSTPWHLQVTAAGLGSANHQGLTCPHGSARLRQCLPSRSQLRHRHVHPKTAARTVVSRLTTVTGSSLTPHTTSSSRSRSARLRTTVLGV
jgi:hypothetical protein